jgi:NADH:ubiquinone oxidoreductase subunit 6 (subunit J)
VIILLLILVAIAFAVQAVRVKGLLPSAIWLAGVSAMTAMLLYLMGARQVAVIELSVGTGLVTVLFVLAINIAGDDPMRPHTVVPRPLAIGICLLLVGVLAWMVLSSLPVPANSTTAETPLMVTLWRDRGLDMLLQVVLIFSGVLAMLGLLSESGTTLGGSLADEVILARERDLQTMENELLEKPEALQ